MGKAGREKADGWVRQEMGNTDGWEMQTDETAGWEGRMGETHRREGQTDGQLRCCSTPPEPFSEIASSFSTAQIPLRPHCWEGLWGTGGGGGALGWTGREGWPLWLGGET